MTSETREKLQAIPALTGTPPSLDLDALPGSPVELFLSWLDVALEAQVPEPRSMTLSTADEAGVPDARVLILRDVDESGWAFASTASSRKGAQLAASPAAALSLWWQPISRAVRVRGPVIEASREESEADLRTRSPKAQASVAEGDWTLWRVQPTRVEFWQASLDRRHHRIVYVPADGGWAVEATRAN